MGTIINTVLLKDIKVGDKIKIGEIKFKFKGFEKRKSSFGLNVQEFFVFFNKKEKKEKIFSRFGFSQHKIKKIKENEFEW